MFYSFTIPAISIQHVELSAAFYTEVFSVSYQHSLNGGTNTSKLLFIVKILFFHTKNTETAFYVQNVEPSTTFCTESAFH